LFVAQVERECSNALCVQAESNPRVEIDLTAGERVPIAMLSSEAMGAFAIHVTVP
jgi:hypothetical protein